MSIEQYFKNLLHRNDNDPASPIILPPHIENFLEGQCPGRSFIRAGLNCSRSNVINPGQGKGR
jgi:hypothetical protein